MTAEMRQVVKVHSLVIRWATVPGLCRRLSVAPASVIIHGYPQLCFALRQIEFGPAGTCDYCQRGPTRKMD